MFLFSQVSGLNQGLRSPWVAALAFVRGRLRKVSTTTTTTVVSLNRTADDML